MRYNKMPIVAQLLHTGKIATRRGEYMLVLEHSTVTNGDAIRTMADDLEVSTTYCMFKMNNGEVQSMVRRFHREGTPEQCAYEVFHRFIQQVTDIRVGEIDAA